MTHEPITLIPSDAETPVREAKPHQDRSAPRAGAPVKQLSPRGKSGSALDEIRRFVEGRMSLRVRDWLAPAAERDEDAIAPGNWPSRRRGAIRMRSFEVDPISHGFTSPTGYARKTVRTLAVRFQVLALAP
jgi:hypothetical protein